MNDATFDRAQAAYDAQEPPEDDEDAYSERLRSAFSTFEEDVRRLEDDEATIEDLYAAIRCISEERDALQERVRKLETALREIETSAQRWADRSNAAGESNVHASRARLARFALSATTSGDADGS